MTSRNKNGGNSMGTLYRQPMGRLVLRYSGYKKSKNLSGETYIQSSNANARVSLNLSIFWLVLVITGELILDDCIYASPESFWISYSVTLTSP